VFADRRDAGRRLAAALEGVVEPPAVVLGVARGGVVVAAEVARSLGAPLDVVIPRKLGAPWNEELGIGAVAPGVRVVDARVVSRLGIDAAYVDAEAERQEAEIVRRTEAYREDRPPPVLDGATAVVVDDGVATGVTAVAALRWARAQGSAATVFAAPVGPQGIERRLARECDACVLVTAPRNLRAVGQWYERFDQTTDDEVRAALRAAGEGR
jgi:putative phosphoribosyl transferase